MLDTEQILRATHLSDKEALRRLRVNAPFWYHKKGYVVPNNQLAPVLLSFATQFGGSETDTTGWRLEMAHEMATRSGMSAAAAYRRLYTIIHGESRISGAERAAIFLQIGGLDLDRDTTIPTLPGSKKDAFDLICIRAETLEPDASPRELMQFVPIVMNLSVAIVENPEMTSQLQDDAPFDCLRPWRLEW